jgi:hypothetical protein
MASFEMSPAQHSPLASPSPSPPNPAPDIAVPISPSAQAERARTKEKRQFSSTLVHGRDKLQIHERVDEMDCRGKVRFTAFSRTTPPPLLTSGLTPRHAC